MNTILRITIIVFFLAILAATNVYAQESPEELAAKHGISFPIAELGNCASFAECRTFCEDPLNSTSCIDYAKSKGFYQEDAVQNRDESFLASAKAELGCDSYEACQNFCEVPANFDRCDAFARAHNLVGGHVDDPSSDEGVLTKAREILGCDSYASCRSFCTDAANAQKCTEFANQTGLRGGEHPVGPGGCTSEDTCKAFCSDPNNFQVCKGFHDVAGGQFSGPGGCNSAESCRTYCQQNPQACGGLVGPGASPPPGYNPAEMCNRTPNCAWTNNGCQCGSYGETKETIDKTVEYGDPATECARYGCSWTGSTCQCTGIHPYSYPTPQGGTCPAGQYIGPGGYCIQEGGYSYPTPGGAYSYPTPFSYPTPATSCPSGYYVGPGGYCIQEGGYSYPSPTDTYSYPSPTGTYSYPSPSYGTPSYGTPESYPSPSYGTPSYGTPESYPTPPVQGVSTGPSLWDLIWQFLSGT